MSLKLNIAANYAGQLYAGLVGIALVPVFLRIMGAEAYGLVGFFTLLQAWSQLLDLGMSATMSRETARYLGGGLDATGLRRLLRSLECVFWPIGVLLALAIGIAAPAIASNWLNVHTLQRMDVEIALILMGATIGVRWVSGLYRGVVTGLERQVWLNGFNTAVVTIRFVGVIPILLIAGPGPISFFLFQVLVSIAELWMLAAVAYSLVPLPQGVRAHASLAALLPVLRFSAGIAFATIVWVLATQADKLIISTLLPLADYGFFTAAVMAASAITMLSAAVSQALLPRLTRLSQQGDHTAFVALYRQATQLTAAITGPMTLALAVLAEPVLWAWTGNASFAATYSPVLATYAIGNGFMTLAAFPYYLQYAKGDLHLHLWASLAFCGALLPAVFYASLHYGAIGAGWVWALSNAAFFVLWAPFVHHKMLPGLHKPWVLRDIVRILVLPCCVGLGAALTRPWTLGRVESSALILAISFVMTATALCMSDLARPQLRLLYRRLAPRIR